MCIYIYICYYITYIYLYHMIARVRRLSSDPVGRGTVAKKDYTEYHTVLQDYTEYYTVLQSIARLY